MSTEIQPFVFPVTGQQVRSFFVGDEPVIKKLESHLYVVEFGDHGIKVGITSDPATRIIAHQRDGKAFGRPATRGWLTAPHVEAVNNERLLIGCCQEVCGAPSTTRNEYFPVPFDAACKYAAALPRSRGDRAAFEVESLAGLDNFLQAIGWPASGLPWSADRRAATVQARARPVRHADAPVQLTIDLDLPGLDGAPVEVRALPARDASR